MLSYKQARVGISADLGAVVELWMMWCVSVSVSVSVSGWERVCARDYDLVRSLRRRKGSVF